MKAGVIDVDIENPDIKIPQTLEIPINDRLAGARDKSTNKRKAIKVGSVKVFASSYQYLNLCYLTL